MDTKIRSLAGTGLSQDWYMFSIESSFSEFSYASSELT